MRLGLIISGLLLFAVAAGIAAVFLVQAPADRPTPATAASRLVKAELPEPMPIQGTITEPDAPAGPRYAAAVDYYNAHRDGFQSEHIPESEQARLTELLVRAMHAGRVKTGTFDRYVKLAIPLRRTDHDATIAIPGIVAGYGELLTQRGRATDAAEALRSVWSYGLRLFRDNLWLENRLTGLVAMELAGQKLYQLKQTDAGKALPLQEQAIYEAADALAKIKEIWEPKLRIVSTPKPRVGDLLNVIKNDQDPTFRLAGVLNLAVVKFAPGGGGNADAIAEAIDNAQHSDDPLIRRAGDKIAALTREDVRKLR